MSRGAELVMADTSLSAAMLDACSIINFYASGRMMEILVSLSRPVFISRYVHEREALRVSTLGNQSEAGATEDINLAPYVAAGLLHVVDVQTEDEAVAYVNFSALMDDGEATTAALAVNRKWLVVTDDRHARNILQQQAPDLEFVTSLEVIKSWADSAVVDRDSLRSALCRVRDRGHYAPGPSHPLRGWWDQYVLSDTGGPNTGS
jgi:predicted nucleic acid-binding protein